MSKRRWLQINVSSTRSVLSLDRSPWSSSAGPYGYLTISFPFGWSSPLGPVFGWYRRQPCKTFRSIRHYKSCEGPFFHEFLVIQLDDGSTCRIERTGDGSNVDALRETGCVANDIIQTFPARMAPDGSTDTSAQSGRLWPVARSISGQNTGEPPRLATAASPPDAPNADLIAEIRLPCAFDLIDVLAICFSIQRNATTRRYTLVRYNCYFFCWTILSVLTRRVANWHTILSPSHCASTLDKTLQTLESLSLTRCASTPDKTVLTFSSLSTKKPLKHLAIRLCSLLDPNSPRPFQFVVDALRIALLDDPTRLPEQMNQATASALWYSDCIPRVVATTETVVKTAGALMLSLSNPCASLLHRAFTIDPNLLSLCDGCHFMWKLYDREVAKQFARSTSSATREVKREYRRSQMENPTPMAKRIVSYALAPAWAIYGVFFISKAPEFAGFGISSKFTLMANWARHSPLAVERRMGGARSMTQTTWVRNKAADDALVFILDMLETFKLFGEDPERIALCVVMSLDRCYLRSTPGRNNLWGEWLWSCVGELLEGEFLDPDAFVREECSPIRIILGGPSDSSEAMTVSAFQEYVKQRIRAHAKHVEQHKLASATLVYEDVEAAITEVWRNMPDCFQVKSWQEL